MQLYAAGTAYSYIHILWYSILLVYEITAAIKLTSFIAMILTLLKPKQVAGLSYIKSHS